MLPVIPIDYKSPSAALDAVIKDPDLDLLPNEKLEVGNWVLREKVVNVLVVNDSNRKPDVQAWVRMKGPGSNKVYGKHYRLVEMTTGTETVTKKDGTETTRQVKTAAWVSVEEVGLAYYAQKMGNFRGFSDVGENIQKAQKSSGSKAK